MSVSLYRVEPLKSLLVIVVTLSVAWSMAANRCAGDTLRTVALTGTSIPGMPPGVSFREFRPPVLNNAGQTAFVADLELGDGGVDEGNDRGLWSEGSGTLEVVARRGSPAPGTPDAEFDIMYYPVLNDAGEAVFYSTLQQGSGDVGLNNSYGVWSEGSGSLQLVARVGTQAPDAPAGAILDYIDEPHFLVLNNAGATALYGFMQEGTGGVTSDTNAGFWTDADGSLKLVVRKGNQPPGVPPGARFVDFHNIVLNNNGEYAFHGAFQPVNTSTRFDVRAGIWTYRNGALQLVAREGDGAPDTPDGTIFRNLGTPAFNDAAQVAFWANLETGNGEVDYSTPSGMWAERDGSLRLVTRTGSQAPGTPDGVSFVEFFSEPDVVMNGAGNIAFSASLIGAGVNGQNNVGIWSEGRSGVLELVARAGDQAPGATAGAAFQTLGAPQLNGAGQVVFTAGLRPGFGGVNVSNDGGIWAQDRDGVLQLVVREGDSLDVEDGSGTDFRTVSRLGLFYPWRGTGNQDGRPRAFNDLGQLVFSATFTDGSSGIFVSSLVAIPEPASGVLAAMAMVGLFRRGRPSRHR